MSNVSEYSKLEEESKIYLKCYIDNIVKHSTIDLDKMAEPETYKLFLDKIRKMEVRADDIWVCSFPKSGNLFIISIFKLNIFNYLFIVSNKKKKLIFLNVKKIFIGKIFIKNLILFRVNGFLFIYYFYKNSIVDSRNVIIQKPKKKLR